MYNMIEKWSGEDNAVGGVNGINAVWNASEAYMTGVVNKAFKFTDPAGCFCAVPHNTYMNVGASANFDLEFFFIPPAAPGIPGADTIVFQFTKGDLPTGVNPTYFGFRIVLNAAGSGYFVTMGRVDAGVATEESSPATISITTYSTIRINYNAGSWDVYVDGVLLYTSVALISITANAGNIYFGYNASAEDYGIDELMFGINLSQYDELSLSMLKIVTAYGTLEGMKNPALTGLTDTAQTAAVAAVDHKFEVYAGKFEDSIRRIGKQVNTICAMASVAGIGELIVPPGQSLAVRFALLNAYLALIDNKKEDLLGLLNSESTALTENLNANGLKAYDLFHDLELLGYSAYAFLNAWISELGL